MTESPEFGPEFASRLTDLFLWRRDVRTFKRDPLPDGAVERLIAVACLAPSVGLSQPWRFVLVDDPGRRAAVRLCFRTCNEEALRRQEPDRAALYARLKLAGLEEAPSHLAVFADRSTSQGHGLGRLTMPETVEYSAVMAVHTLWLAARAQGIGLGWISIIDPVQIGRILAVPPEWTFIGYLCIGYPAEKAATPSLERSGWEQRRPPSSVIVNR